MPRLDTNLLKKLAHGKCFVMVGSGVSVDSGFPSWTKLAESVIDIIQKRNLLDDFEIQKFQKKLKDPSVDKLLEVFDSISNKISKKVLVEIVEEIFLSVPQMNNNDIYSMIAKWPVNCYLTTNYDSELKYYLDKNNEIFTEYGNKKSDFTLLTANAEGNIFKIHGKFDDYENFIISKSDYDKLLDDSKFEYWREKIRSVLHMCTVILIGYSAKDPDFQQQLERAKKLADSKNPVYMFAADLPKEEIIKKSLEYNIKVIPYKTIDGKHIFLKKLLSQYSRFLPKRNSSLIDKTEEYLEKTEYNSAVFIYSDMVFNDKTIISKALYNCILNILQKSSGLTEEGIINELKSAKISEDIPSIKQAIIELVQNNYLKLCGNTFTLSDFGNELLESSNVKVNDYKTKFDLFCKNFLKEYNFKESDSDVIIAKIRQGLEILFKKRGIEIARKIFIDETSEISMSFDMEIALESISNSFSDEQYDAFIDLIISILQTPEKDVRNYLALICNGYFTYHILGHDAEAREQRLNILKEHKIFVDSNILIPLIAINCQNYEYANELLRLIKNETNELYVTDHLLKEVIRHAEWAIENFVDKTISHIDSFESLMEQGGYKENLFIQGALNYSHEKGTTRYSSYFDECFGEEYEDSIENAIKNKLKELEINILNLENFDENVSNYSELLAESEINIELIRENRLRNDSYRSDFQCATEAELLEISKVEPISFLTQTSNLKKLDLNKNIYHWSPESVYRFLQMNCRTADLDNLYNCMVADMYNNGFTVINAENLRHIASPYIHQAELDINDMRKLELKEINDFLSSNLIDSNKNDYSLPFYSEQLQSYATTLLQKQKAMNEKERESIEKERKSLEFTTKERADYERLKQKRSQRVKTNSKKHKNKKRKKK